MKKLVISIQRLNHSRDLKLPSYSSDLSAGADLVAAVNEDFVLNPGKRVLIPSGIAISLPPGYEAQVRPRSGLALKYGITCLNSPGTIDADYRGEIGVILINHGHKKFKIERGMRIAQLVITSYSLAKWNETVFLDPTKRGRKGFGSTGEKT